MHVSEKGQVTIPKHIRVAAGVLPGSEVTFAIEAGNIVISKLASGIETDRREQLRAAAAKVRQPDRTDARSSALPQPLRAPGNSLPGLRACDLFAHARSSLENASASLCKRSP